MVNTTPNVLIVEIFKRKVDKKMREVKDITYIKGVGPKKAVLFNKLDIKTDYDLLRFYPRTYEDWSEFRLISETIKDEVNVVKAVVESTPSEQRIKGGKTIYKVSVFDESGSMTLTFFNNKYIKTLLQSGQTYYFRGKLNPNSYKKEMTSPEFYPLNKANTINPIYHQTEGLTTRQISTAVKECLKESVHNLSDALSDEVREKYKLCHMDYAFRNIHFPLNFEALERARRRLIFEEFLVLQIGMRKIRNKKKSFTSHVMIENFVEEYKDLLPFSLTSVQDKAIHDCIEDFKKPHPMNRLLQGDVGSGKTAVAAGICHTAAKNNIQCAMMAPTEILANQHYNSLKALLEPTGIKVELLTGSLTPAKKREAYQRLEIGESLIAVGTHALITEGLTFKNLGLVITDEQHRFGVKQRSALLKKGVSPHTLVMSATPIPRTLALMIYGDLDISVLDELPPGRQKIETYVIDSSIRNRAFGYVQKHLNEGRQAYIICPLIEESESELLSIESYYEFLKAYFDESLIAVLHGKMKPSEKDSVMKDFSENKTKILLSTTVVEVGVDVPNAVIMIIENAERYGLSQLHQLRGRVGRGKHKSTCILISDTRNEETRRRLDLMHETNDGFKIADEDLKMRGPGDFFGQRQHGLPALKIADMIEDIETLKEARILADEILSEDKNLTNHPLLLQEVEMLFNVNHESMVI